MSIDRRLISVSLVLATWLAAETPTRPETKGAKPPEQSKQQAAQDFERLPLLFEPNLGQTDPQVRFLTRAPGITSFLTDHESVVVLSRRKSETGRRNPFETQVLEQTAVRMKLDGATRPTSFEGLGKVES